jgi:hypothetical protein
MSQDNFLGAENNILAFQTDAISARRAESDKVIRDDIFDGWDSISAAVGGHDLGTHLKHALKYILSGTFAGIGLPVIHLPGATENDLARDAGDHVRPASALTAVEGSHLPRRPGSNPRSAYGHHLPAGRVDGCILYSSEVSCAKADTHEYCAWGAAEICPERRSAQCRDGGYVYTVDFTP